MNFFSRLKQNNNGGCFKAHVKLLEPSRKDARELVHENNGVDDDNDKKFNIYFVFSFTLNSSGRGSGESKRLEHRSATKIIVTFGDIGCIDICAVTCHHDDVNCHDSRIIKFQFTASHSSEEVTTENFVANTTRAAAVSGKPNVLRLLEVSSEESSLSSICNAKIHKVVITTKSVFEIIQNDPGNT